MRAKAQVIAYNQSPSLSLPLSLTHTHTGLHLLLIEFEKKQRVCACACVSGRLVCKYKWFICGVLRSSVSMCVFSKEEVWI